MYRYSSVGIVLLAFLVINGISNDIGHLGVGARADLILLEAPSHAYLAYRPGVPLITAVWQAGRLAAGSIP